MFTQFFVQACVLDRDSSNLCKLNQDRFVGFIEFAFVLVRKLYQAKTFAVPTDERDRQPAVERRMLRTFAREVSPCCVTLQFGLSQPHRPV